MLNKITLRQQHDKWYLYVGLITREHRDEMIAWCVEMWGTHWGETDTAVGRSVFIFHKLDQANWFMLKWAA